MTQVISDERVKAFTQGTHRLVPPEETVRRVQPLLPMFGITRVADVTGLDRIGIPVVVACRPNSRSLSVSQGKGLTLAAAQASAVMESIESWHAERIRLPLRLSSWDELRWGANVVDVNGLPRVARSVFSPHYPLLWIEGVNLFTSEPTWVPYELVHTNYTLPKPSGSGCFLASSNGLASGNHRLEALSHAICEVVERDATTLWHLIDADAAAARRVDLRTVSDHANREVLDLYEDADVRVAAWDVTSDIGIPTYLAVITEASDDPLHRIHSAAGMGCHPDREVALLRALTEAAQSRLTITTGSREDVLRRDYSRIRSPDVLERDRSLVADDGSGKAFEDSVTFHGSTFEDDVRWELERLAGAGVSEVVAVDLTRPDLGIPVVRVVIPGLESSSMLSGYNPGGRARSVVGVD